MQPQYLKEKHYVDRFEPEPDVDIASVTAEMASLERDWLQVEEQLHAYLKELGFDD